MANLFVNNLPGARILSLQPPPTRGLTTIKQKIGLVAGIALMSLALAFAGLALLGPVGAFIGACLGGPLGGLCFYELLASSRESQRIVAQSLDDPLDAAKLGLQVDEFNEMFSEIPESTIENVQQETMSRVREALNVSPHDSDEVLQEVANGVLINPSPDLMNAVKQMHILPRQHKNNSFLLRIPCVMDYDCNWEPFSGNHESFYVLHINPPDIGTYPEAEDFAQYKDPSSGQLDEDAYVKALRENFFNSFPWIWEATGSNHFVITPFGMELEHLSGAYNNIHKMRAFREKIAEEFFKELIKASALGSQANGQYHLCLQVDFTGQDVAKNQIYNAFVKALVKAPANIRQLIHLHINVDPADLAQRLADTKLKVSLYNATKTSLIGNRWYTTENKKSVDENLHRRSSLLSTLSLLINEGRMPPVGQPEKNEDPNVCASIHSRIRMLEHSADLV